VEKRRISFARVIAMAETKRNRKKRILWIGLILISPFLIYFFTFLLIFDLFKPARPFDEEYNIKGQDIAFGPCPRRQFCKPTYHDFFFDGDEWVFKPFKFPCEWWIKANGYGLVHESAKK
jgi:hypothetical protein